SSTDQTLTQEVVDGCKKEHDVTDQDVHDLGINPFPSSMYKNAKDNVKCATECILVRSGFMDSSGQVQPDQVTTYFGITMFKEQFNRALDRCSKVKGSNGCDTAFLIVDCFYTTR
ncbi:hypothetical protein KR009_005726, partial [Drosophila setifemur]